MCGGGLASARDLADDAVFKHDVGDGFGRATAIDESGIADDGLFGICGSHAVSTLVRGGRARHGRAACGAWLARDAPSGYPDNMTTLASRKLPKEPLRALREIVAYEHQLEDLRIDCVRRARDAGASWEAIAEVLGVSRQSAWQLYTTRFRIELDHRVSKNLALSEDAALELAVSEVRSLRRSRTKK